MSVLKPDTVYVDLDCLLDTRLGTLAKIDDNYAVNAMLGDYFTRTVDEFPDVNAQTFKEAYAQRDTSVLRRSVLTNIVYLLASFVKSSREDVAKGGQNMGIEFCVNVHPYKLTDDEAKEILNVLQFRLGSDITISSINVSDQELTPEICKEHYAVMVRYSFHEWLEMHLEAFKKCKMPSMVLYAPALFAKVPTAAEQKELVDMKLDPFQATEIACSTTFALRLLEPNLFSIHDGIKTRKGFTPPGPSAST
jgi:hypothetical protein